MRSLALTPTLYLLPRLTSVAAAAVKDCHGRVCHEVEEYCSAFLEGCDKCSNICDSNSHNYQVDTCARECAAYSKFDPLKADIHAIQTQQRVILILLILLLALIAVRYAYKCIRWMRHRRCITMIVKKLKPNKMNGVTTGLKDMTDSSGATTIQNVMTISELERVPSPVYSVTGAEFSVITMTTPVSTRYPAENSTTPTTVAGEYSYDNQALSVTPIADKPSGTQVF